MSNTSLNLMARMAAEYGVDKDKLAKTLSTTIFGQKEGNQIIPPTPEEMMTLLVICDQYKLNPFTRQVYAFAKGGKVVPIVSIDGWLTIINRQPDYDGLTIRFSEKEIEIGGVKIPEYCECSIRRKGMSQPITIPEYARECYQKTMVWGSYPRRMLRHKAIIQCARVAFGLSGIYDEDEGQNIIDAEELNAAPAKAASRSEKTLPAAQPKKSLAVSSRDEMNKLLDSCINMAIAHSNWSVADKWVSESFSGEELEYARQYIATAKQNQASQYTEVAPIPQDVDDDIPPAPPAEMLESTF